MIAMNRNIYEVKEMAKRCLSIEDGKYMHMGWVPSQEDMFANGWYVWEV